MWPENGIHGCLERRRGIAEPKGHHSKFKMTVIGAKGGLANILFIHAYLVVPLEKVQL